MKRFLLILAIVALFATGCQTDNTNNMNGADNTIAVSIPKTRTAFGEKNGNSYPVYWSEGDKIVINGILSEEANVDTNDSSYATFALSSTPEYPLSITYPYCTSTSAEQPIVEFPATQEYTEGSFALGSAPMCGYSRTRSVEMKHLAGVLRFPIKATDNGVILNKIVIIATNNIAGEFKVNCANATITATENVSNVVTYTLPENFTLSTTTESVFYISLPAVNVGACTIEFVESSGKKMVATWNPSKSLSNGVVREFKTIIYKQKAAITLQSLEVEYDKFKIYHDKVYGHIKYSDGTPIVGVAVSDGFQVTTTNSEGYYELNGVTPQTWYIYCSMPNDVVIPINEFGRPDFYKKYPTDSPRYDFTFEKLPGGPEKDFYIIAMADTQPKDTIVIERFRIQAAPEIKSYIKGLGKPCYGVVLGDVVNSRPLMMEPMRTALEYEKLGMPVFTVMGNHDHISSSESNPILPDERNKDYQIKIQRDFEECFGPVNYSYNRGNVHIVGMRDIVFNRNYGMGYNGAGFTKEQYDWLVKDLSLISKDKTLVLCIHIPLRNDGKVGDGTYRQEVLRLINQYQEVHILSGHTHTMFPYKHSFYNTGFKIYEHTIAATRYDMKDSNIHRDGTPCGYKVLKIENGKNFTDWYYKGFPYGMNTRDYQMRLYIGGTIVGDAVEEGELDEYQTKGYYQIPFDNKTILANIFSSDPSWSVQVSFNGGTSWKTMTYYYNIKNSDYRELVGSGTYEDPWHSVECSRDFWAIGILYGHLGSEFNNNYNKARTMWKYTGTSKLNTSNVVVRAIDSHSGYVYECRKVEDGINLGYALYDPQYNPPIE